MKALLAKDGGCAAGAGLLASQSRRRPGNKRQKSSGAPARVTTPAAAAIETEIQLQAARSTRA